METRGVGAEVKRKYTGRDRGLRDVRGSCLQLYLSSRIHSPPQDVWFHHPCLELAFSWNKYTMWICDMQISASIKTAITWLCIGFNVQWHLQIQKAWRTLAPSLQSTQDRFEKKWGLTSMECYVKLSTEPVLTASERQNAVKKRKESRGSCSDALSRFI